MGSRPWPLGSCDVIPGRHFYRCSIVTKYESPSISEILGPNHIGFTPLNSLGHVTSLVTWPIYSQVAISYRWSIVTKSPAVFEILGSKHIGVTTLTFRVTWRHRSRDHWTQDGSFPIGVLWTQVSISNGFRDIPPQTSCSHRNNAKSSLRMRDITWHVPFM